MKSIKNLYCLILLMLGAQLSHAQLGISYHQSNLPFAGVNYEIADRFLVELRLSTDVDFVLFTPEMAASYQFLDKGDYEIYGGLGARVTTSGNDYFTGVVIPFGAHFFPFEQKNFGFHVELAPIIRGAEDGSLLRGSWGIRYRFGATKTEE